MFIVGLNCFEVQPPTVPPRAFISTEKQVQINPRIDRLSKEMVSHSTNLNDLFLQGDDGSGQNVLQNAQQFVDDEARRYLNRQPESMTPQSNLQASFGENPILMDFYQALLKTGNNQAFITLIGHFATARTINHSEPIDLESRQENNGLIRFSKDFRV